MLPNKGNDMPASQSHVDIHDPEVQFCCTLLVKVRTILEGALKSPTSAVVTWPNTAPAILDFPIHLRDSIGQIFCKIFALDVTDARFKVAVSKTENDQWLWRWKKWRDPWKGSWTRTCKIWFEVSATTRIMRWATFLYTYC